MIGSSGHRGSLIPFFLALAGVVALAGCTADDPLPSGPDTSGVCCECTCSQDGQPCLSVTVEGHEGALCSDMCAAECAQFPTCSTAQSFDACAVAMPDYDDTGDPNNCHGLDQPREGCSPPSQQKL